MRLFSFSETFHSYLEEKSYCEMWSITYTLNLSPTSATQFKMPNHIQIEN